MKSLVSDIHGVPDASKDASTLGMASINGAEVALDGDPGQPVALFLREALGLRGTKIGCGNGECGACTILVDGAAVCSCLLPLHRVRNARILTIEGMARDGSLHPIQAALKEHGAFQCGFCTPGMVMSIHALLQENPAPSERDIRDALQGNVCRCSGYVKLLEAVRSLSNGAAS